MKATGRDTIPFIWFWPHGAPSAALVTHDVETAAGRDFCPHLMDIDESFGIRSSFQIVPEQRYQVTPGFLNEIRSRGHEINVQDLNHDGRLFRDREEFQRRVKRINQYGHDFKARGFRAAVLYRNVNWYNQLEFEYDMSVPNIGHLEAQDGGCCTVFPYFIGDILEIPVTATQDHSLFYVLRNYSIDLWKTQASAVAARHGLWSVIVHPDYLLEARAQNTYRTLLAFLRERRRQEGLWVTTADQVNEWWRQRSQTSLISENGAWRIIGPGKNRARIAYARSIAGRVIYSLEK
jgi:hypothetical protein